jgi:tRNA-intron endonuclease
MSSAFEIYQLGNTFFSNKTQAIDLNHSAAFGESKSNKIIYSIYEVLYLLETKKASLLKGKKNVHFEELIKKANSQVYIVFRDLRDKGNILKEGLKFGTDFRVYEKGKKPGKDHAKYLLYIIDGNKKIEPKELSAKARIAHSTNKTLLLAAVDAEEDISYYAINWKSIV